MENSNDEKFNFSKIRFFIILFLILVGIALCVELGVIFWKTNFLETFKPSFCSTSELIDCDGVALTSYSLSFGVPNFLWGLLLYSVMLMLLFVDRIQNKFKNTIFDVFENPRSYIASLAILSFGISMLLAYISIVEIKKICLLCFCTYVVDFLIVLAAMSKFKEGFIFKDIKVTIVDFFKGARKHFVLFIIVLSIFSGTIYYLDDTWILSPKLREQKLHAEFYQSETNKYAIKGNALGRENAKVKVKLYSDFNCPYCRVANIMFHKLARENGVFVQDVHFPLDSSCNYRMAMPLGGHELSCLESKYAIAAKKQGKYWGVANLFFDKNMSSKERPSNEEDLIKLLENAFLGIDIEQLKKDAYSPEIEKQLQEDIQKAYDLNITGTPAVEINGTIYFGLKPYKEYKEMIRLAAKRVDNENNQTNQIK